jgi:hypothetical protein
VSQARPSLRHILLTIQHTISLKDILNCLGVLDVKNMSNGRNLVIFIETANSSVVRASDRSDNQR